MKLIITFLFLIYTMGILTHSRISLFYAFMGLELWFQKMIPTLLPFMILSGIMIRMNLTANVSSIIYPLIKPIFRVSKNVCYGMLLGFLCGFPMGAKTVQELYDQKLITLREAEFLLSFCNNIGPVYFCGFVLPLLHLKPSFIYLFAMYGLPLLYGLFLRNTIYKDLTLHINASTQEKSSQKKITSIFLILDHVDNAIYSSLHSILQLGGYMILFNVLNLLPHIITKNIPVLLSPLLEITGGLQLLNDKFPVYTLILLPFGGFSCIAQTYTCIKTTPLSIKNYFVHKLNLTVITAVYYGILYWSDIL